MAEDFDILSAAEQIESPPSGGEDFDILSAGAEAQAQLESEEEADVARETENEKIEFAKKIRPELVNTVQDYDDPLATEVMRQTMRAAGGPFSSSRGFYDEPKGFLDNLFYGLTMGEQHSARQIVNGLREIDALSPEETKTLLSANELHGSDLVQTYWKRSSNPLEMAARWVSGVAADILIDPLTYVGVGAVTRLGKGAQFLGKTVMGLEKMGVAERAMVRAMPEIEKVIKGAEVFDVSNKATRATTTNTAHNLELLSEFSQGKLGLTDLNKSLALSGAEKSQVKDLVREAGSKGYWDEVADGHRGLTIGFRVPFTKIGTEVDFPMAKFLTKPTGWAMKQILGGVSGLRSWAKTKNLELAEAVGEYFGPSGGKIARDLTMAPSATIDFLEGLWTKTGYHLFDAGNNRFLGQRNFIDETWSKWEDDAASRLGDLTEQERLDMLDELELGLSEDEIVAAVEKQAPRDKLISEYKNEKQKAIWFREKVDELRRNNTPVSDEVMANYDSVEDRLLAINEKIAEREIALRAEISATSPEDIARRARLQRRPELMDVIEEIRSQNKDAVDLFKVKGVPFEELNPFGKDSARAYVKHMLTRDWLDRHKDIETAAHEAEKFMFSRFGADTSSAGRKYRGTINRANQTVPDTFGDPDLKIFIDDPIALHSQRMREMERIVANYELMESAVPHAVTGKSPGAGWVRFDPNDWKAFALKTSGRSEGEEVWKQFIPKFYKENPHVYLPELVHDRLLHTINKKALEGKGSQAWAAWEGFNTLVRKYLLAGPGYLGQNLLSNMTTYLNAGVKDPIRSMGRSIEAMISRPGTMIDLLDHNGKAYQMSVDDLWDAAVQRNVIRSGADNEVRFDRLAEGIASNPEIGNTLLKKTTSGLTEIATLWTTNRVIAQYSDDIPKFALFMDRLKQGYTLDGAAEAAEKYFFNYNNISRQFAQAKTAYPFLTFPAKSLELMIDEVKNGHIGRLTVPYKAKMALAGAFVEDEETRGLIHQSLPEYTRGYDPIIGTLGPGGRQMLMELPWAKTSLTFFLNPDSNLHPTLAVLNSMASSNIENEEDFMLYDKITEGMGKFLKEATPPVIREGFALAEINGLVDYGFMFANEYAPKIPQSGDTDSILGQRYTNAVEFGKFMEERAGENWLYDMFFRNGKVGAIDTKNNLTDENEYLLSVRGEYIRKKFRDFTLGVARIEPMDRAYFIKDGSLHRQEKKIKEKILSKATQSEFLHDLKYITSKDGLKKIADVNEDAKRLLAIQDKREALKETYDFLLEVNNDYPEISMFGLLTGHGTPQYQFDRNRKKNKALGSDTYQNITRGAKITGDLTDNDIDDVFQSLEAPAINEAPEGAEEPEPELFDEE
jgi:hypothetical protein